MGAGKLPTPGEVRGNGAIGSSEVDEEEGLTVAELVCELLYAGKTRAEIAGYDDAFTHWVLCRRRDESGGLVRYPKDLPRWVTESLDSRGMWVIRHPKPFSTMFRQVMEGQGLDERQQQDLWQSWKNDNPAFGEQE